MLMLNSCVKDNLDGSSCPDNMRGTKIALSIGDMPEVEVRPVCGQLI